MSSYNLRATRLSDYGRYEMLNVTSSFMRNAKAGVRQSALKGLATLHGMNLATTKTLRYDPSLTNRDGINQNGNIRMGPGAFKQDRHWLAAVLFHEVIHSDQFQFYGRHGISFAKPKFESERILVALDECEGFFWPFHCSKALGLSAAQTNSFRREVQMWMVEIDDRETVAYARRGAFDRARRALVKRLAAEKRGRRKAA